MVKGEKPSTEHIQFNKRIVAAGQALGQAALARIYEVCGVPENPGVRDGVHFATRLTIGFREPHLYHPGDVVGSDAFAFHSYYVPDEAWRGGGDPQVNYPGAVLPLRLRFGNPGDAAIQEREYNLYSGPDIPPTLVDVERSPAIPDVPDDSLKYAGMIGDRAPHLQHHPSEAELRSIRTAFEAMPISEVDIPSMLQSVGDPQVAAVYHDPWLVAARQTEFPRA